MTKEEVIAHIKEMLKLREYQPNEYDEQEAKKIYDEYLASGLNSNIWKQVEFHRVEFNWIEDMETKLAECRVILKQLNDREDIKNAKITMWYRAFAILCHKLVWFKEFYDKRISAIKFSKSHDPKYNIKDWIAKELWINSSQVRNVFIKLLLEDKISLEDFKQLCSARDTEIHLYNYIDKWIDEKIIEKNTNQSDD